MAGYTIESLGCRASAADGDAIAAELSRLGVLAAPERRRAQVVVVNTCSVTAQAERTARALIRRVARENPEARIVVTGCYAQRAPQELASMPQVHAVVGNSHKALVAQIAQVAQVSQVAQVAQAAQVAGSAALPAEGSGPAPTAAFIPLAALTGTPRARETKPILQTAFVTPGRQPAQHLVPVRSAGAHAALPVHLATQGRTRPILKVQDGCGNRCSFCVIPETRGPSRSVPLAEALAAARAFAEGGGQELVLSGINLGRWGRELSPAQTLPDIVRALLEDSPLPRLRLSSIEPMDWDDALLALFARYASGPSGSHPRLAAHAHLPLQTGADALLRGMHRRYRPWHYAEKVQRLHALLPSLGLGADVMVGFPGETDALFRESYDFLNALPFTYLHLFPFSPRPGTAAEALHRQAPVDRQAVRERVQALQALGAAKQQAFAAGCVGATLSAVTLGDGTALAANFLSVRLTHPVAANRMVLLRVLPPNPGAKGELSAAILEEE